MSSKSHWEEVYSGRSAERLGWYTPHLHTSLSWIRGLHLSSKASIIDVGGGASTLADDLLDEGYSTLTVLDLSDEALLSAQSRLGNKADSVTWLSGDITTIELPAKAYDLWHDRAVFHFLTETEQQQKYRASLLSALRTGGHLIIGTFALEAPPSCSGLPVQRYDHERLKKILGSEFELLRHDKQLHVTPNGVEQMYLYSHFCRVI